MDEPTLLDVRPILPLAETSLWNKAASRRDEIAAEIETAMRALGYDAWIRRSKPGVYPLYVNVDMWRPIRSSGVSLTTERASLAVTISVEPFLEYPIIYKVKIERPQKSLEVSHWALHSSELTEIVTYLTRGGRKPSFFKSRVSLAEHALIAFVPFYRGPENRLIPEARPNWITIPTLLGSGGLLLAAIGVWQGYGLLSDPYAEEDSAGYFFLALAGIVGMLIAAIVSARRPKHRAVAKQPARSPRREHIVDSWQICVPKAGADNFVSFRQRIHDAARRLGNEIEYNIEIHQSQTPRGFEERERLVMTRGQGNLHLHIYRFGSDAFVGWDSYLNWARWSESDAVSSTVRDGTSIKYCTLNVGIHVPSEFDLMELNALAETVHRAIIDEIKSFLKEKEIEADLDFRIIRGDRAKALEAGKTEPENTSSSTKITLRGIR